MDMLTNGQTCVTHRQDLDKIKGDLDNCAEKKLILCYNGTNMRMGVIHMMGIVAGILVCAFVYVIRETLMGSGEEDLES